MRDIVSAARFLYLSSNRTFHCHIVSLTPAGSACSVAATSLVLSLLPMYRLPAFLCITAAACASPDITMDYFKVFFFFLFFFSPLRIESVPHHVVVPLFLLPFDVPSLLPRRVEWSRLKLSRYVIAALFVCTRSPRGAYARAQGSKITTTSLVE